MASQAAAQPAASTTRTWTPLPAEFDGLARLAASVCQAPLASIVLTGSGEAWSGSGTAPPRTVLPSQDPFYEYTVRAPAVFEVPNTQLDKRFCATDCVKGRLAVRSYAGCALRTAGGEVLGAIAVYGTAARQLSAEQRAALALLAQAMRGASRTARARGRTRAALLDAARDSRAARRAAGAARLGAARGTGALSDTALVRALLESAPVAIYHADAARDIDYVNPEYRRDVRIGSGAELGRVGAGRASGGSRAHRGHLGRFLSRSRVRCDSNIAPCPATARCASSPSRWFQPRAGNGLRRHDQRFHGPGHRARRAAQERRICSATPSTRRRSASLMRIATAGSCASTRPSAHCSAMRCTELSGKSIGELTHAEDARSRAAQLERLWAGEIPSSISRSVTAARTAATCGCARPPRWSATAARAECSVEYLRDITQRKELGARCCSSRRCSKP